MEGTDPESILPTIIRQPAEKNPVQAFLNAIEKPLKEQYFGSKIITPEMIDNITIEWPKRMGEETLSVQEWEGRYAIPIKITQKTSFFSRKGIKSTVATVFIDPVTGELELEKGFDISKRRTLKVLSLLGATLVGITPKNVDRAARILEKVGNLQEKKETDPSDYAVLVDITPGWSWEEVAEKMLGSNDRSEEMQVGTPEYWDHNEEYKKDPNLQRTAILYELWNSREGHGSTMQAAYTALGGSLDWLTEDPLLVALERAIRLEIIHDTLGNPGAVITIDEHIVGDLLEGSNQPVVNMSFQIGQGEQKDIIRKLKELPKCGWTGQNLNNVLYTLEQWFTVKTDKEGKLVPLNRAGVPIPIVTEAEYEDRNRAYQAESLEEYFTTGRSLGIEEIEYPDLEIEEAYSADHAYENLTRLSTLCKRFPDRLFVCSGGNINSYFYYARKKLEDEEVWPDNLLLVAPRLNKNLGIEEVRADGCDIYLEEDDFSPLTQEKERTLSSSSSAAIVSGLASIIVRQSERQTNQKLKPSEIKERLLALCTEKQYLSFRDVEGDGPNGDDMYIERSGQFLDPGKCEKLRNPAEAHG